MVYSKEQTQIPIYLQKKGDLIMSMPFDQNKMLTGTDFEDNVAKLLSDIGFEEVQLMRRDNQKDHGVDIIASKKINKKVRIFNIQCRYHNKVIDSTAVQTVVAGTLFHKNGGSPVVITNNFFTADAREYADKTGVELIGRSEWDILDNIVINHAPKPSYEIKGLLGIMIGVKIKDPNYIKNAVTKRKTKKEKDNEKFIRILTSKLDAARRQALEAAKYSAKADECRLKSLELEKEALEENFKFY